jgi:hypothetical protein
MLLPVCHTKWKMNVKKARNATEVDREDNHIDDNTDLEAYFDEPIADDV